MSLRRRLLFGLGALLASTSCSPCPNVLCHAPFVDLLVTDAADGGAVSGVQATLSGPTTVFISCSLNGNVTLCIGEWQGAIDAGGYALQVAAPGFQTAAVPATVTVGSPPDSHCGCYGASLTPSTVALSPL